MLQRMNIQLLLEGEGMQTHIAGREFINIASQQVAICSLLSLSSEFSTALLSL